MPVSIDHDSTVANVRVRANLSLGNIQNWLRPPSRTRTWGAGFEPPPFLGGRLRIGVGLGGCFLATLCLTSSEDHDHDLDHDHHKACARHLFLGGRFRIGLGLEGRFFATRCLISITWTMSMTLTLAMTLTMTLTLNMDNRVSVCARHRFLGSRFRIGLGLGEWFLARCLISDITWTLTMTTH